MTCVQVAARDAGVTSRSSDVTVIVRVSDVNDNAPIISISSLSSLTTDDTHVRYTAS